MKYKTRGFTEEGKYIQTSITAYWLINSKYVSANWIYTEVTNILQNTYIFNRHTLIYIDSSLCTFINTKLHIFQFYRKER